MNLARMTPKSMIEVVKMTYNLDYARTQFMTAARSMYPELAEEELHSFSALLGEGLLLSSEHSDDFANWSLPDLTAFVNLYDSEFVQKQDDLSHYVMVKELLMAAAYQIYNRQEENEPAVPMWFTRQYIGQLEQIREKVQSLSLDLG